MERFHRRADTALDATEAAAGASVWPSQAGGAASMAGAAAFLHPRVGLRAFARVESLRLSLAGLISLLIHLALLSLSLGGSGLGLPGFDWPWLERRVEAPDVSVVLVPAPATAVAAAQVLAAQPQQLASSQPAVEEGAVMALSMPPLVAAAELQPAKLSPFVTPVPWVPALTSLPPVPVVPVVPPVPSVASPPTSVEAGSAVLKSGTQASPEPKQPVPERVVAAAAAKPPSRSEAPEEAAPTPIPEPAMTATRPALDSAGLVPLASSVPSPVMAVAPSASSPPAAAQALRPAKLPIQQPPIDTAAQERADELAQLDRAARQAQEAAALREAASAQAAGIEAARQEAARQAAARQEAARQEASRREGERAQAEKAQAEMAQAEKAEAARQQAERQEAARQLAARQEAVRQEAERAEAVRQAAARQEMQRQEAQKQEAARAAAARQEAARLEAAQAEAASLQARRAMGRQLDEEAARREAASKAANSSSSLAPASSGARRARLFGRADANAELILYAEAWARKIQLNMSFEMVRDLAKRPHTDPVVTVALRSDGSVESVSFVRSSGVAEIDEAIRRIVQSQLPYPAFQPALAQEFDVIEIRRTWHFDTAIRLY